MNTDEIRYFSMFSGIGGFEYGMDQSNVNFKNVGWSEIDEYARSIYERHYPNHVNYGDATRIRTEELPDFDFLVGGFPCQAFSIAGKRRGFNDTRGTLFFEISRVLKDKRPRYFLLENVKGLLHHNKGETFKTILEVLSSLDYNVKVEVLDSKDFGVPQHRERIFIEGYSRRECGGEVLSFREVHGKNTGVMRGVYTPSRHGRYYSTTNTITGTLTAEGQNSGGNSFIKEMNSTNQKDNRKIKKWGNFSPNNHHGKNIYSTDGLSPTLCVGSVMKNGLNILEDDEPIDSSYRIRRLTPVECERLQGFPDNWTQYGKDGEIISNTQRYKCIGNAVTTNVITFIVNKMFDKMITK